MAAFLRFRERLVVVAKFRGGLHLGKSLFKSRGRLDWGGRVQRAAFIHVHRAPCRCGAEGPAFSLNGVIPEHLYLDTHFTI